MSDADTVEAVLDVLTETAPEIRGGLVGRREYQEGENPSGEEQLAADVHADRLLEERLLGDRRYRELRQRGARGDNRGRLGARGRGRPARWLLEHQTQQLDGDHRRRLRRGAPRERA